MSIEIRNISKRFGDFQALDDVSVDVEQRLADRAARAVRLGQVDAAAHHRGARMAGLRARSGSPARMRRR